MRILISILLLMLIPIAQATPKVVVSIKPVQDLVAAVMADVGEPTLLIPPGADPHDYALSPSDMAAMAEADMIVWIGSALEVAMTKPMTQHSAKEINLSQAPKLIRLPSRDGQAFDPHIWLDPQNAIAMLQYIASELSTRDPEHRATYEQNAKAAEAQFTLLGQSLKEKLSPVKDKPYIVYHDAFQYIEHAYGMNNVGSMTPEPDIPPSAARLKAVAELLIKHRARCIFVEPQVNLATIYPIARFYRLKIGLLDPIGDTEDTGSEAYVYLMNTLADNMKACLE